jgi:hypothetical protein
MAQEVRIHPLRDLGLGRRPQRYVNSPSMLSTPHAGMCSDVPPDGADHPHGSSAEACASVGAALGWTSVIRVRDRPQCVAHDELADLLPQRQAVGRAALEVHAGVHP